MSNPIDNLAAVQLSRRDEGANLRVAALQNDLQRRMQFNSRFNLDDVISRLLNRINLQLRTIMTLRMFPKGMKAARIKSSLTSSPRPPT